MVNFLQNVPKPWKSSSTSTSTSTSEVQQSSNTNSALKELDDAKFSWHHVKVVLVSGMGFFCDAYDLFVISLLTKTIGRIYYPDIAYFSPERCALEGYSNITTNCNSKYHLITDLGVSPSEASYYVPSAIPENIDAALKGVALCGTLLGQLLFGYLGDKYGRKPVFGVTLWLMVIAAICSGFSFGGTSTGVIATLCIWRFLLGVGVGGDYPLAATLTSEYGAKKNRGKLVSAVFAMQGTGILAAAVFTMIIAAIFKDSPQNADSAWRIVLMFGGVPTLATMYARLNLPETPRFTLLVKKDAAAAASDIDTVLKKNEQQDQSATGSASTSTTNTTAAEDNVSDSSSTESVNPFPAATEGNISKREFLRRFGWQLLGTASTWFLLDIAFYSQNLFQSDVFSTIGWIPKNYTMTITDEMFRTARAQALIALFSTIPGYWFTVFTIEKIGRWWIQIGGFFFMTLFMAVLAGDYDDLKANNVTGFVALYALCFFFANWGPNATTFVVPAELFPTQYRSTAHGISAASGKAGAIIGAFGFAAANTSIGLRPTLAILACINFAGLLCTFLVPETKGKSLEEMSGDNTQTKSKKTETEIGTIELGSMN